MIILMVCLFFGVLAWRLAVAYFTFVAAAFGLIIQLVKLAWRLFFWAYNKLRGRRGNPPPKVIPGAHGGSTIGSADDVRPLKDDRPINSRLSDYYRK